MTRVWAHILVADSLLKLIKVLNSLTPATWVKSKNPVTLILLKYFNIFCALAWINEQVTLSDIVMLESELLAAALRYVSMSLLTVVVIYARSLS